MEEEDGMEKKQEVSTWENYRCQLDEVKVKGGINVERNVEKDGWREMRK